ncbi:MAG: glycosyltransferase [Rikenellaceae bacterium]|nr:glycosyltransferase [Rikenellaceae bacterium]
MQISVIIPVYNVEKYIERCIQSILKQSFQDFEIIVVNDHTPDGSMDIVKKYARKDRRFTLIDNPRNMGLMWTRMVGYRNAKGRYFVFCDSDDFLPENALEILHGAITTSGASIVVGGIRTISDNRELRLIKNKLSYGTDSDAIYKSLMTLELMHSLCGKIFDRKLFDNKEFDTFEGLTNGEDGVLFYQLIENIDRIELIDDVVYYYYVNTASATRSRITDNALNKMLFSSDYISGYINKNKPSLAVYLERREIERLLGLLLCGVSKKRIKENTETLDPDRLCSYNCLSNHFNGITIWVYYILLNSSPSRSVYRLLKKIKNL